MDMEKDGSLGRRRRAGAGGTLYFAGVLHWRIISSAPAQGLYLLGDRDEALDE